MLSKQATTDTPKIRRKLIQIAFWGFILHRQRWNNSEVAVETWFIFRKEQYGLSPGSSSLHLVTEAQLSSLLTGFLVKLSDRD
jgi:hypothetical protein